MKKRNSLLALSSALIILSTTGLPSYYYMEYPSTSYPTTAVNLHEEEIVEIPTDYYLTNSIEQVLSPDVVLPDFPLPEFDGNCGPHPKKEEPTMDLACLELVINNQPEDCASMTRAASFACEHYPSSDMCINLTSMAERYCDPLQIMDIVIEQCSNDSDFDHEKADREYREKLERWFSCKMGLSF
jgi:hypothetical protein